MRGAALLLVLLSGCAATTPPGSLAADQTAFTKVAVIDVRTHSMDEIRAFLQPGDLIVNYMRAGRAVRRREWLFGVHPYGHAMIVLDPNDPRGILECRFQGIQTVGLDALGIYSYNLVYRLPDAHRLNFERLAEFTRRGESIDSRYSFRTWVGFNGNLQPDAADEIRRLYSCSTMVAAAYHYAGLSLEVSEPSHLVITPRSIAAAPGHWNQHAAAPIAPAPIEK